MNPTVMSEECKVIEDIEVKLHVTIAEIFHGTVKTVTYTQEYPNTQNLILQRQVEKRVVIAPGADETVKMKFKGEGNYSLEVTKRSDLIV